MISRLVWAVLILHVFAGQSEAQVVFDVASESHSGTTGSQNEASFTWTHTPTGIPSALAVCVVNLSADADLVTSVTADGNALTEETSADAHDAAGEPMQVQLWFLGAGIPNEALTMVVNRTNNGNEMYAAAITMTAGGATEVTGIVLLEGDGTVAAQSVDDGSPGSNSIRVACGGNGADTAGDFAVDTNNSTGAAQIDSAARTARMVRETTAGQGARSVGMTNAGSDDRAITHFAIRQVAGAGGGVPQTTLMLLMRSGGL